MSLSMRRVVAGWIGALCLLLGIAASASAATTRIVAPGSVRMTNPCTTTKPCQFVWAIQQSGSGDTVQFESGEYDYVPTNNSPVQVPQNVTLEPAPGDATRPLIKQTVSYTTCNCAMLSVAGTIEGLEIDQAVIAGGQGAGAVETGMGTIIRSKLEGKYNGMYSVGAASLEDTVVVARQGIAVNDKAVGKTMRLDNVTAIAPGSDPGIGYAIATTAATPGTTTLDITNTIARGGGFDVLAQGGAGSSTITLHYSDARLAKEYTHTSGPGTATIADTDHPMREDPVFASTSDYTEAPGSPTIDAGTNDAASGALDLLALARTVGPATDIGATEWQGLAPAVLTGSAAAVATATATVGGTVDAEDLTTTWHVDYGPTTAYGSQSAPATLAAVQGAQNVTAALTGLQPGTTYHYRLVASNGQGPATGADETFTTAPSPPDTTPPVVSGAALSHRSFAVAKGATAVSARRHHKHAPKGTTLNFTLSERADVTLTVTTKVRGHRKGKRCIAGKGTGGASHAHCTFVKTAGTLTRASEAAGLDHISFTGRIGKRALKPGHYTLRIDATDPSGNKAVPRTLKFRIVKP